MVGGTAAGVFRHGDVQLRFFDISFGENSHMTTLYWRDIAPTGQPFHILRTLIDRGYDIAAHDHDFAELFWVERGRGLHHLGVGASVSLQSGDLVLIRPRDTHRLSAVTEDGFVLVNVAFPASTLDLFAARYEFGGTFYWSTVPVPHSERLRGDVLRGLSSAADALAGGPQTALAIDAFLLGLLNQLQALRVTQPWVACDACPGWIEQLLVQIQKPEHFARGAKHVASLASRAPEHVTRELKRHTGLTTIELVNRARLDYAGRQLRMTAAQITDIADDCGFASLAHFYELFKARFGCAPREYRLRHQTVLR
jgi:AraC-like DNA-binding protein/quercetin dioxygenase-like cupin family protein